MTQRPWQQVVIALLIMVAILASEAFLIRESPAGRWVIWTTGVLCGTLFRLWVQRPNGTSTLVAIAAFALSSFVSVCLAPQRGVLAGAQFLFWLLTGLAMIWDESRL